MLLPATESLERFQKEVPQSKLDVEIVFDSTSMFLQVVTLDSENLDDCFPTIAWSEPSDSDTEVPVELPKKKSFKKLKRRSKHRMVRSKSLQFGLSRLCDSPSSLR